MAENLAFTDRCIARLQKMGIADGLEAVAMNDYLMRQDRLFYDRKRDLVWVRSSRNMEVAVWMMDLLKDGATEAAPPR